MLSDPIIDVLTSGVAGLGVWGMLAVLLVFTQLTIFAVTLYLHRSQAHRGVDFHPAIAHFFRFWTWLTTSMITREWVAIHRKHHAKVETEEDPHSPQTKGIGQVFWRGVELYRQARAERADIEQYGKGAPSDWIERHLYTPHANAGPMALLVINSVLFGLPGIALWAIQMAWIPFWAAGVVNGLGHWWGYRNFESADTSTNLTPWALWIGGEELHNNHHAFPSSARFSMRRWELDIGWVAIRGLQALGLAKVLRVAPSLDIRPNIAVPDADTLKGAALAPVPGHDRLPAQCAQAGVARRGGRHRRQAARVAAASPAQGPGRRRALAQAGCACTVAGMGGAASAHAHAGRVPCAADRGTGSAQPRCVRTAPAIAAVVP